MDYPNANYNFIFTYFMGSNPTQNLAFVITVGLIIAAASATQDITVDALRIEQIGENEGDLWRWSSNGCSWLVEWL